MHQGGCQGSGSAYSLSMLVQRQDIRVTYGEVTEHINMLNDNELHRHPLHSMRHGAVVFKHADA